MKFQIFCPPGSYAVTFFLDGENEINEQNERNNTISKSFIVHKTYGLDIGLIKFSGCFNSSDCHESTSQNDLLPFATEELRQYLNDILPLKEGDLKLSDSTDTVVGSPDRGLESGRSLVTRGMMRDLLTLQAAAAQEQRQRMFGIVGADYFTWHNPALAGVTGFFYTNTQYPFRAGIILKDKVSTLPHELGHSLKQRVEMYCDARNALDKFKMPNPCYGVPNSQGGHFHTDYSSILVGYDGTGFNSRLMIGPNAIDSGELRDMTALMAGGNSDYTGRWITANTYLKTFQTLKDEDIDPKRISISGFLDRDGSFEIMDTVESPDGLISPSIEGGTFKVQILNVNGEIVRETKIEPSFEAVFLKENGESELIEVEKSPVFVSIEVDDESQSIRIINQFEEVIHEEDVGSTKIKSALEIVSKIPIEAYKGRHIIVKFVQSFLVKMKAVVADRAIKNGRKKVAEKQINQLIKKIKKIVKSTYESNSKKYMRDETISDLIILKGHL